MSQVQRPVDFIENYYAPSMRPHFNLYDSKKLKDGSMLTLEGAVSNYEFTNTPTSVLRLNGMLLLSRPESAMISEAGYRMIMGQVDTKKDFRKFQEKMEVLSKDLLKNLNYSNSYGLPKVKTL